MKMIRLKPEEKLDAYHKRRLEEHGWLYFGTKKILERVDDGRASLYEAKSVATGVLCTLLPSFCEELEDALQEP